MIVKELFAKLGLDIDEVAFAKADAMLSGIAKGFLAFGAAAAAGIAIGAAAIAKSTADAADHIKKLSQSTGVNSITLQEFAYSADLAGVKIDEMAQGLRFLAKTGVKDVQAEVLRLAEQFQGMPDDGRKVELAMQKFGRAGARMIPWLNGGRKSLEELGQEAHDLGVIFSEDAQDSAEEFNDNLTRLNYSFAGLRNTIGNKLIPWLNKFILGALKLVKALRAGWTPAVEKLILVLKGLAFVVSGVLLAALLVHISTIITTIGWYVALGVQAVTSAVRTAAAWVAAAAPFAALAALITLILIGLEDLYTFLTGGDSLLGEMLPKWSGFLDSLLADHAEDWWLIRALKWVGQQIRVIAADTTKFLGDIQGGLGKAFTGGGGLGLLNLTPLGSLANVASGATSMFGSGSSPAASAVSSTSSKTSVYSPRFDAQIAVHAAPGMSPQEVAGQVTQALDAHFDGKMRQAAAGIE